jgi:TDG/mug DNA glycosylase family protein
LSKLIPQPFNAFDDYKLLDYGIGFTNIVQRTTRGSNDLSRAEIREGSLILKDKLKTYAPKIAVFNGKGIHK